MAEAEAEALRVCKQEIVSLHEFFVAWFFGDLEDAAFDEFEQVVHVRVEGAGRG
jgi:hypothetical protein